MRDRVRGGQNGGVGEANWRGHPQGRVAVAPVATGGGRLPQVQESSHASAPRHPNAEYFATWPAVTWWATLADRFVGAVYGGGWARRAKKRDRSSARFVGRSRRRPPPQGMQLQQSINPPPNASEQPVLFHPLVPHALDRRPYRRQTTPHAFSEQWVCTPTRASRCCAHNRSLASHRICLAPVRVLPARSPRRARRRTHVRAPAGEAHALARARAAPQVAPAAPVPEHRKRLHPRRVQRPAAQADKDHRAVEELQVRVRAQPHPAGARAPGLSVPTPGGAGAAQRGAYVAGKTEAGDDEPLTAPLVLLHTTNYTHILSNKLRLRPDVSAYPRRSDASRHAHTPTHTLTPFFTPLAQDPHRYRTSPPPLPLHPPSTRRASHPASSPPHPRSGLSLFIPASRSHARTHHQHPKAPVD